MTVPLLAELTDKKPLRSDKRRVYMPIAVIAEQAALLHRTLDDLALVGNGLRACCDAQNFTMPQPIIDGLVRILKATQEQYMILKIALEENGIGGRSTDDPEEVLN